MKITKSQANINSFGGINFANLLINNIGVFDLIDKTPGNRGVMAKYKYSDLFRSYFLMTLCGGECAEDITEHLRSELTLKISFAELLISRFIEFLALRGLTKFFVMILILRRQS